MLPEIIKVKFMLNWFTLSVSSQLFSHYLFSRLSRFKYTKKSDEKNIFRYKNQILIIKIQYRIFCNVIKGAFWGKNERKSNNHIILIY